MPSKPPASRPATTRLHPRNRHQGRYDFRALVVASPALSAHIIRGEQGDNTVDFANPESVKALNSALLTHYYGIRQWQIPAGYLCPPVPGRADYVHALADLLGASHDGQIPIGAGLSGLDIGTGANLIYPLIGCAEYGWQFVGSDIDPTALDNGQRILAANPALARHISLRLQPDPSQLLRQIIGEGERFDFTLCNPPFHASAEAATQESRRKWRNLGKHQTAGKKAAPTLNFGGQANELHCPGGEAGFLARLTSESAEFSQQVFWFSSLVSRATNLPTLQEQLRQLGARDIRIIAMAQGQKHSRLLAWTFLDKKQRRAWRRARWNSPEQSAVIAPSNSHPDTA